MATGSRRMVRRLNSAFVLDCCFLLCPQIKSFEYNEPLSQGCRMTIEELVLEKLRELPPEKQKAVLEFASSLENKNDDSKPLRSLEGLWADLNIEITEEDIAEARREMWGNFPRDIS